MVCLCTYDAWGNHTVTDYTEYNLGNINPIRYRGYYYDTETGLYYLKSRYYDPQTGRFISMDDISYLDPETIGGANLYTYCLNNPVKYVDPSGHKLSDVDMWLLGGTLLLMAPVATVMTCGAASGTIAGAIFVIAKGALIGGAINGTLGIVAGGIGFQNDKVNWSWEGAAEGFAQGVVNGIISGGVSAGLSGIGKNLTQSAYKGIQGLINCGISSTISVVQELNNNTFSLGSIINSSMFGFFGGSLGTIFGEGFKNFLIDVGLQFGEYLVEEIKELIKSKYGEIRIRFSF